MTPQNIGNLVELSTRQQKPTCQCRRHRGCRFYPWIAKIPRRRKWKPTPVLLPGESHGQSSLAGYSPRGCRESNLTEHALKGPSPSLAVSSGVLARVSCPGAWLSRTTWDISISLNTTQTFDICDSYPPHFPSSSSGPKPNSRVLLLRQSAGDAHTASRTPQGCLYLTSEHLPTMVGLQTTLTFWFIPFYFPKHRK